MSLTTSDEEKLARLAHHEGWEVLVRVIKSRVKQEHDLLTYTKFEDLLTVGRSQGAIDALAQVTAFVERRLEKF